MDLRCHDPKSQLGNFSKCLVICTPPLPNVWGMFPTSAVIHDLDRHLFHKSMETHGFSHAKFQFGFLS
jgi:hypothetical protein